uniref:RING finger protein 207 n=1 Tax=Biomphalaria glabrata TaxID=6526 RepID=A0A2C9LLC5_BIOGL
MSGEIFQPMEETDSSLIRNPLLCYLCNEQYEDPCIFGCFHSFCAHCLRGRIVEGKMSCPICGYIQTLKDGAALPPSDLLLKFMVESSTEEQALCANCDTAAVQMFFCNTCMQPLCLNCREETHKAKMFSSHEVVLLTKRAREVHKKCCLHDEPYIMFSSEKKLMLCINCFRDMRIESRGQCLDLETAYTQSFKKLDLRVQAFRKLQNSVREGIILFKGLLEEIKTNADKERIAIEDLYISLLGRLAETKALLLQKVDGQYADKEATFRSQLKFLSTLLPTLHVHLVIASAFRSSANKFEFLDFANVLMERLKGIVQKQHPIHPTQSGQIDTAYKTEFFKSLEPLLYVPLLRSALSTTSSCSSNSPCPSSPIIHRITPNHTRRASGLNGAKVKFIDAKGQFAEHCIHFESAHREILQRFETMKSQCQELQRDLTMRRCLTKKDEVCTLTTKIETIQNDLDSHYTTLEQKLPSLEKHWEECLERLNNEQDLYQAQLQDVMRLRQESQHLRVIASQLSSFVSSIAAVTERLAPHLGQTCQSFEQEQQMASLLEEINSVQPDSQQRVDAIRGAEEERQTYLANRTNPLDSELIKTKGLLKAPSLRMDRRSKKIDKEPSEKTESSIIKLASSAVNDNDRLPSTQNSDVAEKDINYNSLKTKQPDCLTSKQVNASGDMLIKAYTSKVHVDPVVDVPLFDCDVLTKNPGKTTSVELQKNKLSVTSTCSNLTQVEERKFIRAKDNGSRAEEIVISKVEGETIRNLVKDVEVFTKR